MRAVPGDSIAGVDRAGVAIGTIHGDAQVRGAGTGMAELTLLADDGLVDASAGDAGVLGAGLIVVAVERRTDAGAVGRIAGIVQRARIAVVAGGSLMDAGRDAFVVGLTGVYSAWFIVVTVERRAL